MYLNPENAKRSYNEFILLNKNNPYHDPTKVESSENSRLVPITDYQSINDVFHQAFKKIYSKQEVQDSSEAIQEFLDSGGDTKPSEYPKSKALTKEESNGIEGEIILGGLQHALFKKMKGSNAPGIDGFTVNWLRKLWDSLKLVTYNAINECYRDGSLISPLRTGIIRLLRKGRRTRQTLETTDQSGSSQSTTDCLMLHCPEAPSSPR